MTKHLIVPWYDSKLVNPEFRNEIINATIFKLAPNSTNKLDQNSHIPLKTYAYSTISSDRKAYMEVFKNNIFHHMPLDCYSLEKYDYQQHSYFQVETKFDDVFVTRLPLDQQVYQKFDKSQSVGCQHYIRGCEVQCFTCKKYFGCHHCHNDEVLDHQFPRHETDIVRCYYCRTEQQISQQCTNCKLNFGEYYCQICKQINGIGQNAQFIYHCEGCGVCNTGIKELSKHCYNCNVCYSIYHPQQHKCLQVQNQQCIVCFDSLEASIYGVMTLDCTHMIHSHCYQMMLHNNNFACPLCKKTIFVDQDQKQIIPQIRKFYQTTFVFNQVVVVQCNDCGVMFRHIFTAYRYYCPFCKLFNCQQVAQFKESQLSQPEFDIKAPKQTFEDFKAAVQIAFPEVQFQQVLKDANLPLNTEWDDQQVQIIVNGIQFSIGSDYEDFIARLKLATNQGNLELFLV